MCPAKAKDISSNDDGKLPNETDLNTVKDLGNEIVLAIGIPQKKPGHRRAHSDTTLHDDTVSGINVRDDSCRDDGIRSEPVSSDENDDHSFPMPVNKHQQSSTSKGLDLNLNANAGVAGVVSAPPLENEDKHKQPMDAGHNVPDKSEISPSINGSRVIPLIERRKVLSAEKIAEIALVDPRRARRILSNRQSAARSKQRKIQYRMELERKVKILKVEAASLNARLVALQGELAALDSENLELKLKSQTMEQQVHMQDALNDAIRKEIEYLKILNRGIIPYGELAARISSVGIGQGQQLYANYNHGANNLLSAQQLQQSQITSQLEVHQLQLQQNQLRYQLLSNDGNVAFNSSIFKME